MRIKLKRFDKALALPEYKTPGAAAFDLAARETVAIAPRGVAYVPLNVAIATPRGHFLLLAARSSTHKKGLLLANGIGVGDADFCGDADEYQAALWNLTDRTVTVKQGERIMQGIFVKLTKANWKEVNKMTVKTRGGFGSTGKK